MTIQFTDEQTTFFKRVETKHRREDVVEYISPTETEILLEESKKNNNISRIFYNGNWLEIVRGDLFDQVRSTRTEVDMRDYPVTYGARITNIYFILLDSLTDG